MRREPISMELKRINPTLDDARYDPDLFELDGLNEMLLNYVDTAQDALERNDFIGTFIMFIAKYTILSKPDYLYVIKMVLLNELFKKNQNKRSVLQLVNEEHHFSQQNSAAFKMIIKKELRDIMMREQGITSKSNHRYESIIKPFIHEFEDFYYYFR